VQTSNPEFIGRTLQDSNLRSLYSITILAIKRRGILMENIDRNTVILTGDLLYVFGQNDAIQNFEKAIGSDDANAA
jgi:Trk K+ transport system NAD-binding subunit